MLQTGSGNETLMMMMSKRWRTKGAKSGILRKRKRARTERRRRTEKKRTKKTSRVIDLPLSFLSQVSRSFTNELLVAALSKLTLKLDVRIPALPNDDVEVGHASIVLPEVEGKQHLMNTRISVHNRVLVFAKPMTEYSNVLSFVMTVALARTKSHRPVSATRQF